MGQTLETVADSWARSPGGSSMSTVWSTPPFLGVWPSAGRSGPTRSAVSRQRPSASERGRGRVMGSDGEAAAKHAPDEIRVGAELVKSADVPGAKSGPLGVAERVTGHVLLGETLLHLVLARDPGEQLVERVGDGDHGCAHTVAQPVIHSATGS